ncbi:19900_t:CDS:2, partial [Funneliformis geosporum]
CNTTIQSIFDARNEEVEVMVISGYSLSAGMQHDGINKNDILQDK